MKDGCFVFFLLIAFQVVKAAAFFFGLTMVGCLLANWWCTIDPEIEYQWYSGIWHGIFIIPNWTMSWMFGKDILCQAPIHTTGYIIWWWLCLIFHCITAFVCTFGGRSNNYD